MPVSASITNANAMVKLVNGFFFMLMEFFSTNICKQTVLQNKIETKGLKAFTKCPQTATRRMQQQFYMVILVKYFQHLNGSTFISHVVLKRKTKKQRVNTAVSKIIFF